MKRNLSLYHLQVKRKSLIKGSVIATLIAITPFLFNLYESVPNTQVWNTFLFTYDSKHWSNANIVMWIFATKAIPLFLLLIWFFTNKHWWYHALLVPIIMYLYQIMVLFNDDQKYFDEFQLIYMMPVMAVIIPSIYLIRAKMFDEIIDMDKSIEDLEFELTSKPKTFWGKIKNYF
ncbi:hypothetical protein [Neotamlana laminarinivorans]|uniref:Uncharacterized protein n=1 Tax=Neotamlana laminarinivorans TaxID=2883124 RepID=A0A9X1L0C4_9FLAO|nr:hypothetical protein [Tamlana laminarinivorans]MCB4797653.1 hypothetical protein [Tamlana laminarinivorans]